MDISLYYTENGFGEPLVLLHGNGESGEYFKNQIDFFSKKYRVIAVDTRGHGKSERGTAPFTIAQFADDLKCFFDEKGIDKAIVLGFSDGANIAMRFVLKYPERVEKLILNGGNLYPKGVRPSAQIPIEIGYRIAKPFKDKDAKAKRNFELLSLMVNDPFIKEIELEKINCPTLVIAGTHDMIKDSHTKLIARCIKGSKTVILDGTHFIAKENSEEFNRAVEQFLENS